MSNQTKEVKSIDELIIHLKSKEIEVNNEDRIILINYGYFHGYKGYRFYKNEMNLLPITSFKQVEALIEFDTALKALFYDKVMFIETALKNITLKVILEKTKSKNIEDLYSYEFECIKNNNKLSKSEKDESLKNILSLKSLIDSNILNEYKKQKGSIFHYYKKYKTFNVPLWIIFEILTFGNFGFLLKTLPYDIRDEISNILNITITFDTNRCLIINYVYLLKDLRNAIAHNTIIYDCRFKDKMISNSMKKCLIIQMKLPFINFSDIVDYFALVIYFLKMLKKDKEEIYKFMIKFDKIIKNFSNQINKEITSIIINDAYERKMTSIKKYIEKI